MLNVITAAITGLVAATFLPMPANQVSLTLKRIYKTGEVDKYRTTLAIQFKNPTDGKEVKLNLEVATTEETKSLTSEGTVELTTTIDELLMMVNGQEQPGPPPGLVITTVLDKAGKQIEQKNTNAGGAQLGLVLGLARRAAPGEISLKKGVETRFEPVLRPGEIKPSKGVIKWLGMEPVQPRIPSTTAKLKTTIDYPGDMGQRLEATSLVDPDTGKLWQMDGTITGQVGTLPGKAIISFKVVRSAPKP